MKVCVRSESRELVEVRKGGALASRQRGKGREKGWLVLVQEGKWLWQSATKGKPHEDVQGSAKRQNGGGGGGRGKRTRDCWVFRVCCVAVLMVMPMLTFSFASCAYVRACVCVCACVLLTGG